MLIAPILFGLPLVILTVASPLAGQVCSTLSLCGLGTSYVAWYATGIIWRFNRQGKYASGDSLSDEQMLQEEALGAGSLF